MLSELQQSMDRLLECRLTARNRWRTRSFPFEKTRLDKYALCLMVPVQYLEKGAATIRILLPILILAVSGCGTMTTLKLAQENPKVQPIYGGVRTDINCIVGVKPEAYPSGWGFVDWIAKPCSIVDLPLSLAADTLVLPYAIVWTINHRTSPSKDENAGGSEQLLTAETAHPSVAEPSHAKLAPNPMEKAK